MSDAFARCSNSEQVAQALVPGTPGSTPSYASHVRVPLRSSSLQLVQALHAPALSSCLTYQGHVDHHTPSPSPAVDLDSSPIPLLYPRSVLIHLPKNIRREPIGILVQAQLLFEPSQGWGEEKVFWRLTEGGIWHFQISRFHLCLPLLGMIFTRLYVKSSTKQASIMLIFVSNGTCSIRATSTLLPLTHTHCWRVNFDVRHGRVATSNLRRKTWNQGSASLIHTLGTKESIGGWQSLLRVKNTLSCAAMSGT